MSDADLTRSIVTTFEGPDIGPGWVPVRSLVAVLDGLQNAIVIVVEDLWGRQHRPGPIPAEIQHQATFRFGDVRAGSFSATLTLQPPKSNEPRMFDVQPDAVERLLTGIANQLAGRATDLPGEALRHIETLAEQVRRTGDRLILEGGRAGKRVVISAETVARPELRPQEPEDRKVSVIGRLLEIDYKDRRAEVWDAQGKMTRIRFTEDQREQVDAARQQLVAVEGRQEVAPSGKSGPITLEKLETVNFDDRFWHAPSLEELAAEQGVRPVEDPSSLVGDFWEDVDGEDFLATLRRWRRDS